VNGRKASLRDEFRQRRRGISPRDHEGWSAEIHQRLRADPAVHAARNVFSYLSCGREVETISFLVELKELGKRVFAPSADRHTLPTSHPHELSIEVAQAMLSATANRSEIPGPQSQHGVTVQDIDVFLVPGIVWDERGYRIGFGGGYFDRLLAMARPNATLLGLAFDLQVVRELPPDPWDVPVHRVITESRALPARK